jgi:hypothetical protein
MAKFFHVLTIVGTVIGGFLLVGALTADSAPKQAAEAAIAVAFGVLPYCFARACTELAAPRAPGTAPSKSEAPGLVRCSKCETMYVANAKKCPNCGAHRFDAFPLSQAGAV